jgi:hypothetical protein
MSLFDFLFGSRTPEIRDPGQLKDVLFQAAVRGDHKGLERLCRKNRQTVLDNFSQWEKPPEEVRNNPAAMHNYAQAVITVASLLRQAQTLDGNPVAAAQANLALKATAL